MSKIDQSESAAVGIVPAAVLTSAFLKGAEIWINGHCRLDKAQREAFETWPRSLKKMCQCRNPVDFVRTRQDWLCDAIRLTASDTRALAGDTAILTRKTTAGGDKTIGGPADDILKDA